MKLPLRPALAVVSLVVTALWLFQGDENARAAPDGSLLGANDLSAPGEVQTHAVDETGLQPLARNAPGGNLEPTSLQRSVISETALHRGRIRVGETEDRLSDFDGNGELTYRDLSNHPDDLIRVPIEHGSWDWREWHGANPVLVVDHLLLEGRTALARSTRTYDPELPGADLTVIEALWTSELVVHVHDRDTGRPLEHVEVRYEETISPLHVRAAQELLARKALNDPSPKLSLGAPIHSHAQRRPELEAQLLVNDAPSPISLEQLSAVGTYWFGAPGYEWVAWPEYAAIGEETPRIELRQTGDVHIQVDGFDYLSASDNTFLYVYRGESLDAKPLEAWRLEDIVVFQAPALVPDLYRVQLQEVAGDGYARLIAGQSLQLSAGETANVLLTLPSRPAEISSLSGRVFLRGARADLPILSDLTIEHRDGPEGLITPLALLSSESDYTTYEITSTSLTPGTYVMRTRELPMAWVVEINPGESYLELEIPNLQSRWFEAFDESTGEHVPVSHLTWTSSTSLTPGAGLSSRNQRYQTFELMDIPASVVLPAGDLELTIKSPTHGYASVSILVQEGQRDLRVTLKRRPRFVLSVLEDGEHTAVSYDWARAVRVQDREGREVESRSTWDWNGQGLPIVSLWLEEPGEFVLIPPSIPGLPTLAPKQAVLMEAGVARVTFSATTQ